MRLAYYRHAQRNAYGRDVHQQSRLFAPDFPLTNVWTDTSVPGFTSEKVYVQTTPRVIQRCLLMATDPGDLMMDCTFGSGMWHRGALEFGASRFDVVRFDQNKTVRILARQSISKLL